MYKNSYYSDVIIRAIASQITSLTIFYSTVYSVADQRKHQSSASLAFVRAIHRWPVYSPHKGPVTQKIFPFDYVIVIAGNISANREPSINILCIYLMFDSIVSEQHWDWTYILFYYQQNRSRWTHISRVWTRYYEGAIIQVL